MKEQAVIYIHGKGGNAGEAGHYKALFPDRDVMGFDYRAETPWEAKDEFTDHFEKISNDYRSFILIANSIGAFFAMQADAGSKIERAFFISPIVDMEKLIKDMMVWAGVTEEELHILYNLALSFFAVLLFISSKKRMKSVIAASALPLRISMEYILFLYEERRKKAAVYIFR